MLYPLLPAREEEAEKPSKPFIEPRKTEEAKSWRIIIENGNEITEISYGIRDRYKKALGNQLANPPFMMLSEKEIICILRNRGLSKGRAYNLMHKIKGERLKEG